VLEASGQAGGQKRLAADGRHPLPERQPYASYSVFRIGDAVAAHNIHAAIYDGARSTQRL
jgi:N-methyl-L-proline demethylase